MFANNIFQLPLSGSYPSSCPKSVAPGFFTRVVVITTTLIRTNMTGSESSQNFEEIYDPLSILLSLARRVSSNNKNAEEGNGNAANNLRTW